MPPSYLFTWTSYLFQIGPGRVWEKQVTADNMVLNVVPQHPFLRLPQEDEYLETRMGV